MSKVALATVGCKTNQYETEVIRERLELAGWKIVPFSSVADVYIINTCTVTGRADQKSISMIKKALKGNSSAKIFVTGCLVESDFEKIRKKFPQVQIVRNVDKLKIDTLLTPEASSNTNFTIHRFSGHERAFVKVEDGCNQFCTYCKVPYVRGSKIRSRDWKEVVFEIKKLLRAGYREIVVTGVNLALYGKDFTPSLSLTYLLQKILPYMKGKGRIRLSSLEPHLIPDDLLDLMASEETICPHLHLSLQSGDDKILEKMGRKYTTSQIKNLVEKFREKIPEVGITGDIIVGFPGEEEENFCKTCEFVKELQVHRLHIFTFSPRAETPASKMRPKVPEKIKKERSFILKQLSYKLSQKFINRFVGKNLSVLIESKKDPKTGYFTGYTHNYIKVLVPPTGDNIQKLIGEIVPVKIKKAKPGYAVGEISNNFG